MTTTQPPTSPPARQVPGFELALTIVGAVCGAIVPAVLTAGAASDPAKLAGMALGAALPPLVGAAGSKRPIRVAVVAVLTVAAVVLSYGGLQIFAKVTDTEPAVAPPKEVVTILRGGGGGGDDDPEPSGGACEEPLVHGTEDLGLAVCPPAITCTAEDDCPPVTVTSTGAEPLQIGDIEFDGEADTYVTLDGCEHTALAKGEECTIALTFSPEKAPESGSTNLVIHQNLPKIPTRVPLEAEGTVTVSPNLALGAPFCDPSALVEDAEAGSVSGELAVGVPVTATGLPDVSSVRAAVYVDGVEWQSVPVDPDGDQVIRGNYEGPRPGQVLVRVDPDNLVQESASEDEADNDADNVAEAAC
jgi:hypothetical protein